MSAIETCSLCPRLCRVACPVATGAAWEAAVPAQIAGVVLAWQQGRLSEGVVRQAVTACVDCGACQVLCHLHVPLPDALRQLRRTLQTAPAAEQLQPIEGQGAWVAVETGRSWSHALAAHLGESVASWKTSDALGADAMEHAGFDAHLEQVGAHPGGYTVVAAHGGVIEVLRAAGVSVQHLDDVLGESVQLAPCCGGAGPLACCGARGPLVRHHPDAAARLARHWALREGSTHLSDERCANHLKASGIPGVQDAVDRLLGRSA